ncbi:hypothetical protein AC579_4263 [Pseudocercospora musae]|uniref:Amidohydrolase-related domain-containing protein n=1 Tax=Pseudocercospora musae TaxID=113226 RepID=A0A139I6W2_9PEZI|nr:hypothetical protein AC579_4263 [Pseudocercospora musae]
MSPPNKIITLEEHWCSQHIRTYYKTKGIPDPNDESGVVGLMTPVLQEWGPNRLKDLEDNNITTQIVSHVSNTIPIDSATCSLANDDMAQQISQNPKGRYKGFAILPMNEPQAAAAELRRCVNNLGLVGALIDDNTSGRFYDDPSFWPVFATAEELDVPMYIHPSPNNSTKSLLYDGNYPDAIAIALSQFGWGWHSSCAITFLRMFSSGFFDTYPNVKIVLGHMGEMLPFQFDRISSITSRFFPAVGVELKRGLREVWDTNVWVTTSGMFSLAPIACLVRMMKKERIMLSVDFPFTRNELGVKFLESLKADGMVSEEEWEGIAWRNAEKLLKLFVIDDA